MANNSTPRLSSFDLLQDYEQRSLVHAPGRPEMIEAAGHWRGVGYRLGKRRFVSSFDEIVEIITLPGVTPVLAMFMLIWADNCTEINTNSMANL